MSIFMLVSLSAASEDEYAVVIYGNGENIENCLDCYANLITSTDTMVFKDINIGMSEPAIDAIGVGEEGLSASIIVSPKFLDTASRSEYIIHGFALRDLPGNGIMIADTQAPIILKDIIIDSPGLKMKSSEPVGIGMKNARNVSIENCTALKGALFRITNSHSIMIKNDTAKNFFLEGLENSTIENCTADCIMIKGMIAPFYSANLLNINASLSEAFLGLPKNVVQTSKWCLIKNCSRIKEIDLFNTEDCVMENCIIKDVGLWMVNADNTTVRNISVVDGNLCIDWSRQMMFKNLTLVNSDISITGSVPEDFSVDFENCSIDGMPILYYENRSQLKLQNMTAGQIWLRDCPLALIDGCTAREIFVINSEGVVIQNSQIYGEGIDLIFSEDCVLSNNTLSGEVKEDEIIGEQKE